MTGRRHSVLGIALAAGLSAQGALAADQTPAPAGATPAQVTPGPVAPPAPAPELAPVPSLMFTPSEIENINKAIADHIHPPAEMIAAEAKAQAEQQAQIEAAKPRVPNIYVSAVLDFGGGQWTVWANGLRVTPTRQPPMFKVVSVSGNTVEIVPRAQPSTHIRLQPYQTWRSREGDVVEGIVP